MSLKKYKISLPIFNLPFRVTLGVLIFLIVLALIGDWQIRNLFWSDAHNEVRDAVLPIRDNLSSQVQRRLTYLDALRTYLELDLNTETLEDRFESFAAGLTAGIEGIRRFTLSPDGIIRYLYPLEGGETFQGTNIVNGQTNEMEADVQRAIQTRRIVLSRPVNAVNGGIFLLSRVAIMNRDTYWGLAGELTDLFPLMQAAGLSPAPNGLQVALRDSTGQVFWGEPQLFAQNAVMLPVNLPEGQWELAVVPQGGWEAYFNDKTQIMRAMSGVLIGLLTLLTYRIANRQHQLSGTVQKRTVEVERLSEGRRLAEDQLRQSEAITSAILESSLQSFVMIGRDQTVLLANQITRERMRAIFGHEIQTGSSMRDVVEPEQWDDYQNFFNQALNGKAVQFESNFISPNQQEQWLNVSFYPVRLQGSEVIGVCISTIDLTGYKRTEERLSQSEQRFLKIFQANPAAIAILTRDTGIVVTLNERMEALMGYTEKELVGKKVEDLDLWVDPSDQTIIEKQIEARHTLVSIETRWRTRVAGIRDVIVSTTPIMLAGEDCLLILVTDNTERRRSEQEREQLFRQVQAGRERLRELTRQLVNVQEDERRRISRELHDEAGQALTAVSISLELVESDLSAEQEELRQRVRDSIELTHTTLDRIRSLAQMLRPPALDALGLVPTLAGQCQVFQRRTQIPVNTFFEDLVVLPETYNITIYRCLQEALTNVARHAQAGHVWVELRREAGEVCLIIEDDGIGMAHTGDKKTPDEPQRLGLIGLQERLELLEGRLDIESREGRGTRLVARLPLPVGINERSV